MTESDAHLNDLDRSEWIGRVRTSEDRITLRPARFMEQTLDREASLGEGDPLPPAWHWLYFLDSVKLSATDRDGHSRRGDFLPPVALPRRMWAGSRLTFHAPIHIGDVIQKESRILDIQTKHGKSGALCFVTVSHTFRRDGDILLVEEHDIVYREDPPPGAILPEPPVADTESDHQRIIDPSPLMLFRYSALTFNGHRIHYDIDYCRDVEGYPGLVFHGPLTATLLLDLLSEAVGAERIRHFSFRAMHPLFADRSFAIHLKQGDDHCHLWAATPDGGLAVKADAAIG